jgi:hypothetical protein
MILEFTMAHGSLIVQLDYDFIISVVEAGFHDE